MGHRVDVTWVSDLGRCDPGESDLDECDPGECDLNECEPGWMGPR